MLYVMHGLKREGADEIRARSRVEHLEYMMACEDVVAFGGSFQAPDGSWGGMTAVISFIDDDAARDWLENEPYTKAGLFQTVFIAPFRQLMPEPSAGLLASELSKELEARRLMAP